MEETKTGFAATGSMPPVAPAVETPAEETPAKDGGEELEKDKGAEAPEEGSETESPSDDVPSGDDEDEDDDE